MYVYKKHHSTNGLVAVKFWDSQKGVASGANGTLLITNNGGEMWTQATLPSNVKCYFDCISLPVQDTGFVSGRAFNSSNGFLFKTTDAGNTWKCPFMYKHEVDVITASTCVGYGMSFPFYHKGDNVSIEANPLALANIIYTGRDFITGIKMPLSVCFRFGAHAKESSSKSGSFGLGGGLTLNALRVRSDFNDNTLYAKPSLMFEFGNNDWKIRFDWIFKHTTYYKSYTGNIPYISYTQFSVTYVAWEFR